MGASLVVIDLSDDHVQIEELKDGDLVNGVYRLNVTELKCRAKVLAVGPGSQRPDGGRFALPCKVGDTVLVNRGAGFKWTYKGVEHWFVYGNRGDIIGVITE
jgi:co-chaperonin GroES (HSP10)